MTKPVLLSFHSNGPAGRDQLSQKFDVVSPDDAYDKEKVVAINCTMVHQITDELMETLPNLEIIATFSVGFDHIDLQAAKKRNVKVTNTPQVLWQETADTGMALLLATARRIAESDRFVRAGRWLVEDGLPLGTSLADKKIGIVGLGGIGKRLPNGVKFLK